MESINKCLIKKNDFCYVCGTYISFKKGEKKEKIKLTSKVALAFQNFYGIKIIKFNILILSLDLK